ncbi:indolepyruvate ferredoxin oxidoreductase family protein [Ruegeria hyattellae]|uniref:indolepyruvate ferredoxin oxidoreductase family protein n=1 Tax=Ruegeria hyattellae TaxID=3233337 RepID=UPI00355BD9A8
MTLLPVELSDKFDLSKNQVYLTGTQALIRLCQMRSELDKCAGLNTAGYVTGYRGSPLGNVDQQFSRAGKYLDPYNVKFEPGLNEDLAATAVWGTQQAEMRGEGAYDGVFSIWYAKGPGVDRTGDALRHGNLAGSSKNGGVIVLMGDDHTCESSTTCHQSEYALVDALIPVLNPSNVQEIIEYGLHGWALSRYAGVWCGLKCVKDNIESSASIDASVDSFKSNIPTDFDMPEGGLNIRTGDSPQTQEARLHQYKIEAAKAYVRANALNKVVYSGGDKPRVGIVSTGKSYMDTLQALDELGIDEARANELGLALFKVSMPWPLEPQGICDFSRGLDLVIVVEEKRGLMEDRMRVLMYNYDDAPKIIGKLDEKGRRLFQVEAALNPIQIAAEIGKRIGRKLGDPALIDGSKEIGQRLKQERKELGVQRKPYFCAGCPHNSSTRLPDGSRGYAGIGCSWMAQFMDRRTEGFTQMGAEGASWIGESRFSKRKHMFQNLGDGTYNHSGLLAIRAAVASNTNITYKILYNDAVAMTGGQPHEGDLNLYKIAAEVHAAGIRKLVLVSDHPDIHPRSKLPTGTRVENRDNLLEVETDLRDTDGVTVLLYEQTCAAEKRRRRKRGLVEDPAERAFINDRICEGCGDCGVQSNCVAILPNDTGFGRKRMIDQAACNKDFSCVNGFCPSFVTIKGGGLRKATKVSAELPEIPLPAKTVQLGRPYAIALTGVGGTGVVTIGALLGMAAHLDGFGCGLIDMTGMAQKGGAVTTHIKIAKTPEEIKAIRIAPGSADLVLGCDLVVSAGDQLMASINKARSKVVVNTHEMMTGDFTRDADFKLPVNLMLQRLTSSVGDGAAHFVDATKVAGALMGNSIASNLLMLGVAFQHGLIPVSAEAISRAIELNGVAIEFNKQAFQWGRMWVHNQADVEARISQEADGPAREILDERIARLSAELVDYQDDSYAQRYLDLVEQARASDPSKDKVLTDAVARYAYKVMAYKDEYEVARLYSAPEFSEEIAKNFDGDFKLSVHLAPPLLTRMNPKTGRVKKIKFGSWVFKVFPRLARMKKYRGTKLDLFGYTAERRAERALIGEYEEMIHGLLPRLDAVDYDTAVAYASLPERIRGFGHVKERHIADYHKRKSDLEGALASGKSGTSDVA